VDPKGALAMRDEDVERLALVVANGRCGEGDRGVEDFDVGRRERRMVLRR